MGSIPINLFRQVIQSTVPTKEVNIYGIGASTGT
jgi:hypothetical protein